MGQKGARLGNSSRHWAFPMLVTTMQRHEAASSPPCKLPRCGGRHHGGSQVESTHFCYWLLKCGHSRGNEPQFGCCQRLLSCCCCFLRLNGCRQTCTREDGPIQAERLPSRMMASWGWGFGWKTPPALLPSQKTLDRSLLLLRAAENNNYQQNNNHCCLPWAHCSQAVQLALACIKQGE